MILFCMIAVLCGAGLWAISEYKPTKKEDKL